MADLENDALEVQIREARRAISSDGYPMSIGELTNLYREQELRIRPEFQRLYRWSPIQKSRLVESLLLGIPLPSIFVSQAERGVWELVDGLQRVSTILELQGELRDEEGKPLPALVMEGTKYLPALEGRSWAAVEPDRALSPALKLDLKRTKVDIKILQRESSPEAKFDLFQRLNSYGSQLTAQEMRSALLVGASPSFFAWLQGLVNRPTFRAVLMLNERLAYEQYDLDLVLRFLVLHDRPSDSLTLKHLRDFNEVLDVESLALAKAHPSRAAVLESTFKQTFDFIADNGGEQVFRRWDAARGGFRGPFLNTAFELFALGIGFHIASGSTFRTDLLQVVQEAWQRPELAGGFATGRSTESRLAEFVPLGRKLLTA
jgi:hypothetical protein